jgi:signal transduction histidine kinase
MDPEREYLERTDTVLVVLDRMGRIAYLGDQGRRLLGLGADDISDADWIGRFVPEAERERVRFAIAEAYYGNRGRGAEPCVIPLLTASGGMREVCFAMIPGGDGMLLAGRVCPAEGSGATADDERLRRLSTEFRTLLDALPEMVLLLSPDLSVRWANRGALLMLGRGLPEVVGRHCHDIIFGRADICDECRARECVTSAGEESFRRTMPGGQTLLVRMLPVIAEEGAVADLVLIAEDISKELAQEAETMRTERLAALGKLAAGIAHEVNNPVTSIINYARLIRDEHGGDPALEDLAERIDREGTRISGIVRSLLSFAREGRDDRKLQTVREIVDDILYFVEMQIRKEGISFSARVPEGLPQVRANSQQVQQVLLNLVNNARDALNEKYPAGDSNKAIRIVVEAFDRAGTPHVRFTVHDTGTGIPEKHLAEVFNPFFSLKPGGMGTGLGLSICQGIVANHGGAIRAESVEGEWTRMIVELPAEATDAL